MRFKTILFISFAFFAVKAKTQVEGLNPKLSKDWPQLSKDWLVAIEGDTISVGDFWYVYNKNADPKKVITRDSLLSYRTLFDKFLLTEVL